MTPIFALYKKWQQRQASSPKKEKSPNGTTTTATAKNTPPQPIPRPSELYFQKLTPLLNKHNIKATQSSRKEWPVEALKEVLAELTGLHFICSHFLSHYWKLMLCILIYPLPPFKHTHAHTQTHSRDSTRSSIERTLVCISFAFSYFFFAYLFKANAILRQEKRIVFKDCFIIAFFGTGATVQTQLNGAR